uniref:Uncharacterized protein n=1 Tax=Arundo donax TaxID=35708 RepID=A0A0A9F9C8_ARUDO
MRVKVIMMSPNTRTTEF